MPASRVLACVVLSLVSLTCIAQQPPSAGAADSSQSLADIARKLRPNKPPEVKTSQADAKTLFQSVDEMFAFASQDSGFPKRNDIKRQLVGQSDVEKYTREQMSRVEFADTFERAELTMKKFGLLPRDFNLREFLVKANGQEIAGYYDPETKSISLLDWVPLEQQKPILAHELTHALQDQNYDLKNWMKIPQAGQTGSSKKITSAMDEATNVKRAVVEGQAMVVYLDFLLSSFGRNLENTPGVIAGMEEPAVKAVIDTELLHNAPMVLREMGTFPYREGLIFEGELLAAGGKKMAFAGAFARPPRSTHEILQPRAYIEGEKLAAVRLPDLKGPLTGKYEVYDSGGIGELDVRALLKQYGERRIAEDLARNWLGGAYAAFKPTKNDPVIHPTTSDLALLYVSRWKTPQAAQQFARIYGTAVKGRYRTATAAAVTACAGDSCPTSSTQFATEEGPVAVDLFPDGTVIVTEGFEESVAGDLRKAVRGQPGEVHAEQFGTGELGLRLLDVPAFREFQTRLGLQIEQEMLKAIR